MTFGGMSFRRRPSLKQLMNADSATNDHESQNLLEHHNIEEEIVDKLYFTYCPRVCKWTHRTKHSLLHPHISTTVHSRRMVETHLIEELDFGTVQKIGDQFRIDPVVSKFSYRLQFMNSDEKWALFSQMYEKQVSNKEIASAVSDITENLSLYYPFENAVNRWWDAMTNGGQNPLIERASYFNVFVKLYDILAPYSNLVGPTDKVSAIQTDFRADCRGKSLGVAYEQFLTLMLELCENWVNTNPEKKVSIKFDPDLEVDSIGNKYCEFLKEMFFKVFKNPGRRTGTMRPTLSYTTPNIILTPRSRSDSLELSATRDMARSTTPLV